MGNRHRNWAVAFATAAMSCQFLAGMVAGPGGVWSWCFAGLLVVGAGVGLWLAMSFACADGIHLALWKLGEMDRARSQKRRTIP